ncbi:MAG: CatB-related O-acetyltransferase [Actinomycetota bacterium]
MPITIGKNSMLDDQHEVYDAFVHQTITIGNFTQIGPGVVFCGAINHVWVTHKKAVTPYSFNYHWKLPYFADSVSRGPINIGNDVWMGRDVFILDGVTISDGAIVGARAVVAKDVPPYAVVVGNPARIVHYRYEPDQIEKLLKIKWWLWSNQEIRDRIEDFKDIEIFLAKYYKEGE